MNQNLIGSEREQMSKKSSHTKNAETTREALIFFFSQDGKYLRDLVLDTVIDGADSLSKGAIY